MQNAQIQIPQHAKCTDSDSPTRKMHRFRFPNTQNAQIQIPQHAKCTDSDSPTCKMHRFRFPNICPKSHLGICSPVLHSVVSSDSVSGQWRPWSDCADLGFHCPYMLEHVYTNDKVGLGNNKPFKILYSYILLKMYFFFFFFVIY